MKVFAKNVVGNKRLTVFTKSYIPAVWLGFKYASNLCIYQEPRYTRKEI